MERRNNSADLFALALVLESPWKVERTEMVQNSDLVGGFDRHIYIGTESGCVFSYEGHEGLTAYDRKERTWRHLNFFQHRCYLHCRVPRVRLPDGKVRQVEVPWARTDIGFTLLFEAFAMQLIEAEMPIKQVGRLLGEYPGRIWRIFNHWVGEAIENADHSGITQLGIDETSRKRGHEYVTLGVDLKTRKVVYVTDGKDSQAVARMADHLSRKGSPSDGVEHVCIDLSRAFIAGAEANFPNASLTFDRFHIQKLLNEAMDKVRLQERKAHNILKGMKYAFLSNTENLTKSQHRALAETIDLLPNIGKAYRLKELFADIWAMKDKEQAAGFLAYWCDPVVESGLASFKQFAHTIYRHWDGFINYFETKLNNGILEGINAKIQLAKRRARGYTDIAQFIKMIYFIAGKLKMTYHTK